ncbi:hypothetical protein BH623125_12610 [Bartonella henselae]|nr:hypothetical protein BH623125_12610 [Bartonella henselae]
MTSGGKIAKSSALVTQSLIPSSNIMIQDGGVEIVENGKTSIGATVEEGGKQIVTRGGKAIDTKISGGKQFVFEESPANFDDLQRQSSAYDAIVSGGNGVVGQQNVYDDAKAWNTKVTQGGEQNLYMGNKKIGGGFAENTVVSGNGRQHILAEGMATNTILKDKAVQVVYPGGIIDRLTVNGSASSWLYVGADLQGEIKVNDKGHLYLFAGDRTDHIIREKLFVEGRVAEWLFGVGERNNNETPQIEIDSLSGDGGTIIFSSVPYDRRHISLHVEFLSGTLHFNLNISTKDENRDYLSIGSNSAGNHTISITDSGAEITSSFSRNSSIIAELNLITDRSQGEGANFALANYFGKKITAVDGGAYMYTLQKRNRCADSSGDYTVWYLGVGTERADRSNNYSQCVKNKSKTRVPLVASSSDVGVDAQSHQNFSSSQRQDSNSQTTRRKNNEQTSKPRPPRHLRDAQHPPIPPTIPFLEKPASDTSSPTGHYHFSDEQQQSVVSTDGQSLADQMILRPGQQGSSSPQSSQKLSVSHFLTTPSTDAVLSMSVIPALVFHNELQAVRAGRGILDRGKKNTAFWAHAIKSKEHIVADHKDFKLDQTGIVLGVSGVSELMGGEFYIGGFGSYDQARVAHARGGVSGINTYSIGAYATYFDKSGWYLDSILKYNQYQNNLKAVSTNGIAIEGNYNQWGLGNRLDDKSPV